VLNEDETYEVEEKEEANLTFDLVSEEIKHEEEKEEEEEEEVEAEESEELMFLETGNAAASGDSF
jgi:hypothetical protein